MKKRVSYYVSKFNLKLINGIQFHECMDSFISSRHIVANDHWKVINISIDILVYFLTIQCEHLDHFSLLLQLHFYIRPLINYCSSQSHSLHCPFSLSLLFSLTFPSLSLSGLPIHTYGHMYLYVIQASLSTTP